MKLRLVNLMASLDPMHDGEHWINWNSVRDIDCPQEDVPWCVTAAEYNHRLRRASHELYRECGGILFVVGFRDGRRRLAMFWQDDDGTGRPLFNQISTMQLENGLANVLTKEEMEFMLQPGEKRRQPGEKRQLPVR